LSSVSTTLKKLEAAYCGKAGKVRSTRVARAARVAQKSD